MTRPPDRLILDDLDQPERPGDRERVAEWFDQPVVNRGRKHEPEGQSALPRFNRYSIPTPLDPKAVDCPYCVKRPRNLAAHCRAVHPDKPEARL